MTDDRRPRRRVPHPSALVLLGVALLACGLSLREARREGKKHAPAPPSLDARLAPLVAAARGARRVGFVDLDDRGGSLTRRVSVQFALAPTVVTGRDDADVPLAVSCLDGVRLAAYARREGREVLASTPDGYALLGRRAP